MAEKKEETSEYKAVQVPASYANAVGTPDGEAISVEHALAEILNRLEKLEKVLA